jgi:putative iron-only hydrogenase system regulator
MEKRIASVLIVIRNLKNVPRVNQILSAHGLAIRGRLGLPMLQRNVSVISLVLEATTDELGSLTGQLGRIQGVEVKSVMSKLSENERKE